MRTVRVAVCQMRSDDDVERNLALAERLLTEAADGGAEFATLPEYLDFMGPAGRRPEVASPIPGPLTDRLGTVARERSMWVLAGGVLEAGEGGRVHDTSVVLDPGVRSSRPTGRSTSTTSSCPTSRRSVNPTRSPPATRS